MVEERETVRPERIVLPSWVKKARGYRVELLSPINDFDPLARVHKLSEESYAHTIDFCGRCTCFAAVNYGKPCVHLKLFNLVLDWLNCPYHPNPTSINAQYLFAQLEEDDERGSEVVLCRRCLGRAGTGWPGRIIPADVAPVLHSILGGG